MFDVGDVVVLPGYLGSGLATVAFLQLSAPPDGELVSFTFHGQPMAVVRLVNFVGREVHVMVELRALRRAPTALEVEA